ncbi:hypothetical protein BC936DRAFT_145975, partial [Jimgerdemannia flammicorona]
MLQVRLDIDVARSIDTSDANSDKTCSDYDKVIVHNDYEVVFHNEDFKCEVKVELGKAKVEQDWKKWSADLRQAAKKSVRDH